MNRRKIIYMDNAATTKMSRDTLAAMEPYFAKEYANPSSAYEFGMTAEKSMEHARREIASVLNCLPEEIYFTSGGTESDNWAIMGAAFAGFQKGNHIITTKIEHPAVKNTCRYLEHFGFDITWMDVDRNGFVKPEEIEKAVRKDTILISVMTANNEIGTIQPVYEIGKIAKHHKVIFHTDAVQAFCHIPIDVEQIQADLLSGSSHKFGGPKGMGFLYIRKGTEINSYMHGGHQERGMRAGTGNVPGAVGMGKAAAVAWKNMDNIIRYETMLRNYMIKRILAEIPRCRLNGDGQQRLPGNINMAFEGVDGGTLAGMLDMKGICISTGSACSSGSSKASEVLTAIGLSEDMVHSSVRITISILNTREEADYVIETLKTAISELRKKRL